MKKSIWLGVFLCLLASVSWGAMFPVAHDAFTYIDPFYFTIFRYGSVTILLVIILFLKEGKAAFQLQGKGLFLWFYGTMAFTVYNLLIFFGQDLLGESGIMSASIMESLMPMISILIVWMLHRQKPRAFTLVCVFLSFIGAALVITKGDVHTFLSTTDNIVPSLLLLVAVIGWVIYTMGGEQFSDWSSLRYSTLSCLLGTITVGGVVFVTTLLGFVDVPTIETIKLVSPHLSFMIIFPGIIALLGWNVGIKILSPLNGLLFINFVPVTTLVISSFQGNPITTYDYIGATFIILSLVSNNVFLRFQQKKTTENRIQDGIHQKAS